MVDTSPSTARAIDACLRDTPSTRLHHAGRGATLKAFRYSARARRVLGQIATVHALRSAGIYRIRCPAALCFATVHASVRAVITVILTRHLFSFFPQLAGRTLEVQATTVAEAVAALQVLAPGIEFYLCDERGRLRQHVNAFIGNDMICDRGRLSDPLSPGDRLSFLQALSGG